MGPDNTALAAMVLLEEALELPSNERRSFIEGRTDLSEEIRALALDLLAGEQRASGSLETGGAPMRFDGDEDDPSEIGGYRVVERLGRGGMGAVYLAERTAGDFEHLVAIKVIKPGVLTEPLVERFRRERQILAQLQHPNIAHLYDGGETGDGQPYIVMEYVRGTSLADWFRAEERSLDERLDLFVQTVQAVEFAHQNLIIHRDLTPGNVLVTESGQAKLIDFGIARPQSTEPDNVAASTFSGLSLTPGFAAPERARGEASTTLSDIYSLGKILALMIGPDGPPELLAISRKACTEDPAGRYASASEVIDEIERYQSDEPVTAFSDAPSYRLRKFVSRQKLAVGAAAAVLVALLAGLAGTGWAYREAEIARQDAEQRFTEVRDLANFQIFGLYDQLDSVVGNTAARLAVAERAQKYLEGLANTRNADAGLQLETANGFTRLALIQGVPAHPNFGEPEQAAKNLERAETIYRRLAESGIEEGNTGLARALAYHSLIYAHGFSKPVEAKQAYEQAEEALEKVPAAKRDWEWMQSRRALRIAQAEWGDLELDNAVLTRTADNLESEIKEWPIDRRGGYEEDFDTAVITYLRAIVLFNENTEESRVAALTGHLEADSLFGKMETEYPNDPLVLYYRSWNAYYGYAVAATIEDDVTADRLLQQARDSVEQLMRIEENDNSLETFAGNLREAQAEFFSNTGKFADAIRLQGEVMDIRLTKLARARKPNNLRDAAYGHAIYGSIFRKAGRRAEACSNWQEAEKLMAELAGNNELSGYVESLRAGVQANLRLCRQGAPVSAFQTLA